MIKKQNIICFGSENWQYPGFQQTVMRLFSEENKILFVNALGIRKISLRSSQSVYYLKRIKRLFQRNKKNIQNLLICNPCIIPFVYNEKINKINKILIRVQFSKLLNKQGINNYLLWVGTPTAASYLGVFNPKLVIYNPVDRYREFSFANSDKIIAYEKIIAEKSDLIIATSDAIREDHVKYNSNSKVVNHGVNFEHFNKAIGKIEIPQDMKSFQKPIIGYFGKISEWIDLELIKKAAIKYPDSTVILIGKSDIDLSLFKSFKNIHILGFRKFDYLPAYLKCFDVCLIPFQKNELINGVDPIKLREYLCAGKPVVTTNFHEAKKWDEFIHIGIDDEDFINKIGKAIDENNYRLVKKRINQVRKEDWSEKIKIISSLIQEKLEKVD